jgi:hypothetical protein
MGWAIKIGPCTATFNDLLCYIWTNNNTKWDRGENYFERYYRNGSSPWFREIKMNRRAFVPINRMRADHTSLKASLNRFNIVSTAECECGDGLQTEVHIF